MIERLSLLKDYLKNIGLARYASKIDCIIKVCSMPGVDGPVEETDVDGIDDVLKHIEENPGLFIWLDNPKGSKKRFGQKSYKKMPFHYGEFTEINNPADDMGWDIIIVPSSEAGEDAEGYEIEAPPRESEEMAGAFQFRMSKDELKPEDKNLAMHVPPGHNLVPVGYVPVNDSQEEWTKNTATKERPEGKRAPVGNDKVILAADGNVTDEDKKTIEDFFAPMWNFKDIVWL
jgi:hypothetical protein